MVKLAIATGLMFALSGGLLISMAPDMLSLLLVIMMCLIIAAGFCFSMVPCFRVCDGFRKGRKNVARIVGTSASDHWLVLNKNETLFGQKQLDRWYNEYMKNARKQYDSGAIVSDFETVINEDTLSMKYWFSLCSQIPGTMTGLGLLGTFLGLILGIANIGFSSVGAALDSVETLLQGIEIAFYTSIAGVILSILYNLINKLAWNVTFREMGMFMRDFHSGIIPTAAEQERDSHRSEYTAIIERLDRLPKDGGFHISNENSSAGGNEQNVMNSVQEAMKNGEFQFYLQPRCDLNTREIIGAEALIRWDSAKLGVLNPQSFMPVLEKNGFVARLDQYIWDRLCAWIRQNLDDGIRPLPVSINVSSTDILAFDVPGYLKNLLGKYEVPPVQLEIEIGENVYLRNGNIVNEVVSQLRTMGLRVLMDGFNGDFFAIQGLEDCPDMIKLNMAGYKGDLASIFKQARELRVTLVADRIESMEQMKQLRKNGCTQGQGYILYEPMEANKFRKESGMAKKKKK